MKLKNKFSSYGFWMSLTASIVLLLNCLGETFGFSVNETQITEIVNAICGVLVVLGIIVMPKDKTQHDNTTIEAEESVEDETKEINEDNN